MASIPSANTTTANTTAANTRPVNSAPAAEQKTAVVTGASRGIGLAIARMLAAEGFQVYGLARHGADESGISFIPCDVTEISSVQAAFDTILGRAGAIDLLVVNAGMGVSGAAEFTEEEAIDRQLAVNLTGAIRCARQVIPSMREKGRGRIVFISSLGAIFPLPFQSFYSVSKAGVNAFCDALGLELRPFGIETCALLLNDVKTDFTASRAKNIQGDSLYGGRISASVTKMEISEQHGMEPGQVAASLKRLLGRRRLPPHYIVGFSNQVLGLLYRLLPTSWMLKILGRIYG